MSQCFHIVFWSFLRTQIFAEYSSGSVVDSVNALAEIWLHFEVCVRGGVCSCVTLNLMTSDRLPTFHSLFARWSQYLLCKMFEDKELVIGL